MSSTRRNKMIAKLTMVRARAEETEAKLKAAEDAVESLGERLCEQAELNMKLASENETLRAENEDLSSALHGEPTDPPAFEEVIEELLTEAEKPLETFCQALKEPAPTEELLSPKSMLMEAIGGG